MPVLIVTAAILVGAGLILKAIRQDDGLWDSLASYQRRERCNGADHIWPELSERKERA